MSREIKTGIDIQMDIYNILASSDLPMMINGGIYYNIRPLKSKNEDIVIGILAANGNQILKAYLNVNVHVPNIKGEKIENSNAVDNFQPDQQRFYQIGLYVISILDGYNGSNFSLALRKPGALEGYQNDWYYNIQIEYTFLRKDIND